MKVKNRNIDNSIVVNQEPFEGSNLSGFKFSPKLYVVYSYGHYPLWACINGKWYGHNSKYSQTTSCHQSQSQPEIEYSQITILDTVDELKAKIAAAR
ncbi:MAG: hypothetical protein MUP81_01720 [Dehalococcoidia bacterium]|nr:hypothetical protein [Dehalococcoidia bacterium]